MRLRCLLPLLWASLVLPAVAPAAEITDVIDAADGDDPFDANIEVRYDFDYRQSKITRESSQNGVNVLVRELDFQQMTHTVTPRLQVGAWHDLALFADFPLVIYDQRWGQFSTGVRGDDPMESNGQGYSTLAYDRCRYGDPRPGFCDPTQPASASVRTDPSDPNSEIYTLDGQATGYPVLNSDTTWDLFDTNHAAGSYRSVRGGFNNLVGFGDMDIGLAWAPLNQERSVSQPTWVLRFKYTIPTGKVMNPIETASNANPGGVGLGLHQFTWSTAFAHRFSVLEPYIDVAYTFGVPGANALPDLRNDWVTASRHLGQITAGVEVVPYENKALDQRFAIDLRGVGIYHGQQRTYTELSDAINEVTLRDQYSTFYGHLGFFFSAARFIRFDIGANIGTDTNHFITGEKIGTDKDGNGILQLDENGDGAIERSATESNPFYNPVLDTPGRRLRVEETLFVNAMAHLALTF
ncbi:MAG: hypothetical protein JXR83_23135 [Deltaproteobacteria bacterium]|nr:hypothetical protein [Deltaproteobacteria bacterium]